MLGGETTFTDTAYVGDLGSGNLKSFARLLVEIIGNASKRAFVSHGFTIVSIKHSTPGIGVPVAGGAADHGEAEGRGGHDERSSDNSEIPII